MSKTIQAKLVKTSVGRVVLHLTCLLNDFKLEWHMKGIVREFC